MRSATISLLLLAFVFSACRPGDSRRADLLRWSDGQEAYQTNDPPVANEDCASHFWIYVPRPSIDKPRGAPAEVALPRLPYTTNRIELFVGGEVAAPGAIKPPQGCTVLQAVSYAGGFTDFAFTRRLKLMKSSGQS